MKIWSFLKWHYNQFDIYQKIWLVAIAIMVFGATADFVWVTRTGFALVFSVIAKWFIIDPIKYSYENFKKEQQDLFNTIKHSDSK